MCDFTRLNLTHKNFYLAKMWGGVGGEACLPGPPPIAAATVVPFNSNSFFNLVLSSARITKEEAYW